MLYSGSTALFDQTECFGNLHHDQGNQNQTQTDQILCAGKGDQTENCAQRGKQHQTHQQNGGQRSKIQIAVGEHTNLEQGMLGAHIECLHHLRERQYHEGKCLTAFDHAGLGFAEIVGDQRQHTEHDTLKDDLKYIEAFARHGYIGTVCGVNLYDKKDAKDNEIVVGTRKAVTAFIKKGTEVELYTKGSRAAEDANIRKNTAISRKYYVMALTNETQVTKIIKTA